MVTNKTERRFDGLLKAMVEGEPPKGRTSKKAAGPPEEKDPPSQLRQSNRRKTT